MKLLKYSYSFKTFCLPLGYFYFFLQCASEVAGYFHLKYK